MEHRTLLANTPIINEFMASNSTGLRDQFDEASDWIEIHNPTASPMKLDGWHLTDEIGDRDKWTFPAVTLGPGGYLVVFATGKNLKVSGAPFHTNFNLSAEGEYLALTDPDNNVVQEFNEYPEQVPDVSYGIGEGENSTTLVGPQSSGKLKLPTSGVDDATWMQHGFGDSGWTNVTTGVGFDQTTANTLPSEIEPNDTIATADDAQENFLGSPGDLYHLLLTGSTGDADYFNIGQLQVGDVITVHVAGSTSSRGTSADTLISFRRGDPGGSSEIINDANSGPGNEPLLFRYTITTSANHFIRVDPQLGSTGTYQVGVWLENVGTGPSTGTGSAAEVEPNNGSAASTNVSSQWARVNYRSRTGGNRTTGNDDYFKYHFNAGDIVTVKMDSTTPALDARVILRDAAGTILAQDVGTAEGPPDPDDLDANIYAFRIPTTGLYYVQAAAATGAGTYNLDVYRTTAGSLPGQPAYTSLINTDIGAAMRNVGSSAYLRIPFNVTDPTQFDLLTLRMKYDDAFVAYLNGEEVAASTNSPDPLAWNSVATSDRPPAQGVLFQEFDLTSSRSALRAGPNVLAIHGLNQSAGNIDFLILPQLDGTTLQTQTEVQRYFQVVTPGGRNGTGAVDVGPALTQIAHGPHEPTDAQDVLVTARVEAALDPVQSINLIYRVMYGNEITAPMRDDGQEGDAIAGDKIYTARIPADASSPGQMVRYAVTATDSQNRTSRWPLPQGAIPTAQYLGFIIPSNEANLATTKLPVFHWYTADPGGANSGGARASVYYMGEFYDNVFVRRRGANTTAGNKFEFTPDHDFKFSDDEARVDQININSRSTQPAFDDSYIRSVLSFETFRDAGSLSLISFNLRMQLNGSFQKVGIFIEQPDADFLRRHGLYEDSARYKMTTDHEPMTNANLFEKKNRESEGRQDLQDFLNGIQPSNPQRTPFIWDNFDVIGFLNYWGANQIVNDNDDYRKNYYLMRDTRDAANPDGNNMWFYAPWDKDLTFGKHFGITPYAVQDPQAHPLFGDGDHRKNDSGQPMVLNDLLLKDPRIKQMYLRRLRTLMDQMLGAPDSPVPVGERYFEKRVDELHALLVNEIPAAERPALAQIISDIKTRYVAVRRNHFYIDHSQNTSYPDFAGIPAAQPANVVINFGAVEFLSASNNPLEEYIELRNPNAIAVDISGWKLSGGIDFEFRPGTVIAGNSSLYVAKNVNAFRARTLGPRGGQSLFITGGYEGQLSTNGETLLLHDDKGRQVSTITFPGTPSPAQNQLRITEVMFNPAPPPEGSPYVNEDFEYIELQNIGGSALNLTNVHFGAGVTFNFTGGTLAPGAYTVLVRNVAAFQSRYGSTIPIGGTFVGSLDNAGENLELQDARNEKIVNVDYQNGWYDNAANGEGFSLVIRNTATSWREWDRNESWRPSALVNGNPGAADNGLNPNSIVISEVMPNGSSAVGGNWIELRNQTNQDIPIGGWFLSDTKDNLRKWTIPGGTVIPGNGHVSFSQDGGFGAGFTLSALGGDVFLAASDGAGNLAGYRDGVDFDGAAPDVSFGRYIKSTGASDFVALKTPTREGVNTAPTVGPIVITEFMYRPLINQHEFIELRNISGAPVSMAGWAFTDGVTFTFPGGTTLAPSETVLVVPIDPAQFRSLYSIPAAVKTFGPYTGVLSGAGEGVTLSRPGTPVGNETPMIRVDRVSYEDDLPWPAAADGKGPSLARIINQKYGNDVANWRSEAAGGTPGRINTGAPYALETVLEYGPASPRVVIRFSEHVGASLQTTDLVVTRLSDFQPVTGLTIAYDPATFTATWTLPTTLADANYRLFITSSSITDGTSPLDGDSNGSAGGDLMLQVHHLAGDANQDRVVDHQDFALVNANFGQTGKGFAGGDYNFDGKTDFKDFQILERQFGKTLTAAPAAPVASAPSPAPVPVSPVRASPVPVVAPGAKTPVTKPVAKSAAKPAPVPANVFAAKRIQPAKRKLSEVLS